MIPGVAEWVRTLIVLALLATLLAEKTDGIQKQVNRSIVGNVASGPAK